MQLVPGHEWSGASGYQCGRRKRQSPRGRGFAGTMRSGTTSRSWREAGLSDEKGATHLADNVPRLRIPAESPVVFTAREKEVGILLAPRNGEDSLGVTAQYLGSAGSTDDSPFRGLGYSSDPRA